MLQRALRSHLEDSAIYAAIARSIGYLSENHLAQPSLDEAARAAGISPFHFQREFTRLAGVSPKAFVAHLTLENAKASLKNGASLFDAALDAGLSGPSRLHDLSLKIEAMTPGDYAKGGAGLVIRYGFHPTLFGAALVMATDRGLCGLAFTDEGQEEHAIADMRARWPKAAFVESSDSAADYGSRIFGAQMKGVGPLPVQLFGTPWQIKVWQALIAIPEGRVVSYGAIAAQACATHGSRAARAVGAAVGRNPVALVIPCHRVLAANGALSGYHWGPARKRALLALEGARAEGHPA